MFRWYQTLYWSLAGHQAGKILCISVPRGLGIQAGEWVHKSVSGWGSQRKEDATPLWAQLQGKTGPWCSRTFLDGEIIFFPFSVRAGTRRGNYSGPRSMLEAADGGPTRVLGKLKDSQSTVSCLRGYFGFSSLKRLASQKPQSSNSQVLETTCLDTVTVRTKGFK